jgi:hypothetical protein
MPSNFLFYLMTDSGRRFIQLYSLLASHTLSIKNQKAVGASCQTVTTEYSVKASENVT